MVGVEHSDWLRTADVARRWPIPESTLRYWRHRGLGPPSVKVGRHVLYRIVDVESWLTELQRGQAEQRIGREA
jgi:DNA-binding transcriptional MerR regulator